MPAEVLTQSELDIIDHRVQVGEDERVAGDEKWHEYSLQELKDRLPEAASNPSDPDHPLNFKEILDGVLTPFDDSAPRTTVAGTARLNVPDQLMPYFESAIDHWGKTPDLNHDKTILYPLTITWTNTSAFHSKDNYFEQDGLCLTSHDGVAIAKMPLITHDRDSSGEHGRFSGIFIQEHNPSQGNGKSAPSTALRAGILVNAAYEEYVQNPEGPNYDQPETEPRFQHVFPNDGMKLHLIDQLFPSSQGKYADGKWVVQPNSGQNHKPNIPKTELEQTPPRTGVSSGIKPFGVFEIR